MSERGRMMPTSHDTRASLKLKTKPVDANTWPDFDKLFSSRGAPGYCWCMAWRVDRKAAGADTKAGRKAAMTKLVKDGVPVGLLGYVNGEPVAWCSIAPFDTHMTKLRKVKDDEDTSHVWSVTCFFVRRDLRGQGLTKQLLSAAVKLAKKHGAKVVEGYGVSRDSPSYRHMGFVPMFEDAGFEEVGREGRRRRVMRMAVGRSRSA